MSATPARPQPVGQDGGGSATLHNKLKPTALPRRPDSIGDRRCGRALRLGSVALPDADALRLLASCTAEHARADTRRATGRVRRSGQRE